MPIIKERARKLEACRQKLIFLFAIPEESQNEIPNYEPSKNTQQCYGSDL